MKLFIWEGVLTDWSDGIMFAMAHEVEEARALLRGRCEYLPEDEIAQEPAVYDVPTAGYSWGGG